MPRKRPKRLTLMQQLFVDHLLSDPKMSQQQAAILAGYEEKSADAAASRLVRLPQVQAAIDKEMNARARRTHITKDSTLRRIDALSRSNLKNIASWKDGGEGFKIRASDKLTEEEAFQIESIDVREYTTLRGRIITRTRVKMRKPDPAILMLGRHQGLFDAGDQNKPSADLEDALKALDQIEKDAAIETPFKRLPGDTATADRRHSDDSSARQESLDSPPITEPEGESEDEEGSEEEV